MDDQERLRELGWTTDRAAELFKEAAKTALRHYPHPPVTAEVVGFMTGFITARGFPDIDVSDVLLAVFMVESGALPV
jgi:hypothetical protein